MSPESATVSKAAPADVVFTVSGATTLTSLKIGNATVNASNYSFSNGTLTILGTYLAGLATGTKTFTLVTNAGSALVTVAVTE